MIIYLLALECFSVDPFTRKDWYDVKAPAIFKLRDVGKTLVNRTQGTSKFISWDGKSVAWQIVI